MNDYSQISVDCFQLSNTDYITTYSNHNVVKSVIRLCRIKPPDVKVTVDNVYEF